LFIINGSDDLIEPAMGEPLAVDIGVRRVKKFIRFWILYRSRIASTSLFVVVIGCDDDDDDVGAEEGSGEVTDDDGDVVEVLDGVLERIRLAVVEV